MTKVTHTNKNVFDEGRTRETKRIDNVFGIFLVKDMLKEISNETYKASRTNSR